MTQQGATVAKKGEKAKGEKAKAPDQHKSGFLVRIPEAYRPLLLELKKKTGRPIAVSVRWALDAYLRENGVEPPAHET